MVRLNEMLQFVAKSKKMTDSPARKMLLTCLVLTFFFFPIANSQVLLQLEMDRSGQTVVAFRLNDQTVLKAPEGLPLISWVSGGRSFATSDPFFDQKNKEKKGFTVKWQQVDSLATGCRYDIFFINETTDTLVLENVVPFGCAENHPYITGKGDHWLSRSHLFLPGKTPVNVILPDNAWESGYSGIRINDSLSVCALTRRKRWDKAERHRFDTRILPGGSVTYSLYAETYRGDWQEGLRRVFQERYLYDLPDFDRSLYDRKDLQWIRDVYVMHLIMAWDEWCYDREAGRYTLQDFLEKGQALYGGDDAIGIWPTWPTLGLDQRNQWDLFRDMPGGLAALKRQADSCRMAGTKFFVCYNPWDESTRVESHTGGMASLIVATGADGVVLDTRGESSRELQAAADSVRKGVVMYSEGMAIPKHMPGIVAGRVHNALYYPPMLNLNKLIMPEFAIFRVAELYLEPIRREFNVAFFNGYGTELNVFHNGKPAEWMDEQYRYWGRTARLLREHTDNFHVRDWQPLIPVKTDGVYVNQWDLPDKSVFTVYSLLPAGYDGPLFEADTTTGWHYVDLWQHQEIVPVVQDGSAYISLRLDAFPASWLGTNNEGAVSCVARFRESLKVDLDAQSDRLFIQASQGTIRVWAGSPAYDKTPLEIKAGKQVVRLTEHFGRYEGKFVVQLLENGQLKDERVVELKTGTPRLISGRNTSPAGTNQSIEGMIKVPPGLFIWKTTHGDDFVSYPDAYQGKELKMPAFYMDKYPVTNAQYEVFLQKTGYRPADTTHFLRHWTGGKVPAGQELYPVVYVSLEDAQAYADWAEKRLPTELEWQYAAQYPDGRSWPWGNEPDTTRCNPGNGFPDPVGKYPGGASLLGLEDLTGQVWQLTSDIYQNASYTYVLLKGGSYFKPEASWWYVQGGPQPLTHRQQLLRVSPGFERNRTVGFRCVR